MERSSPTPGLHRIEKHDPKGVTAPSASIEDGSEDHGWHPTGVLIAMKTLAGGVAWDHRPTLDHRLMARKPSASLGRLEACTTMSPLQAVVRACPLHRECRNSSRSRRLLETLFKQQGRRKTVGYFQSHPLASSTTEQPFDTRSI